MNIREFSLNLQKLYAEMAETFLAYQKSTGLNCPPGCGRCCLNPDIEASALEMIPMALKIYQTENWEEWMEKLETSGPSHCLAYNGKCGMYEERPSVCRMFGVAGHFNKYHQVTHTICKYLKEEYPQEIVANAQTPIMTEWSSRLTSLDPNLLQDRKPINAALREALQKVALLGSYEDLKY